MMRLALKERKPFCLAVSLRLTQGRERGRTAPRRAKMLPLRPRRLCGENSILDKHRVSANNRSYRLEQPHVAYHRLPQRDTTIIRWNELVRDHFKT